MLPTRLSVVPILAPANHTDSARPSFPLWQILVLLGLFMIIASVSVVDPRPEALKHLGDVFRQLSMQASDESVENKQDNV